MEEILCIVDKRVLVFWKFNMVYNTSIMLFCDMFYAELLLEFIRYVRFYCHSLIWFTTCLQLEVNIVEDLMTFDLM